jgi:hypothetical protein
MGTIRGNWEKKTFSKSEKETVRRKKKQDGYGLKRDREKDLFGFR